jgi:hypothetical protein
LTFFTIWLIKKKNRDFPIFSISAKYLTHSDRLVRNTSLNIILTILKSNELSSCIDLIVNFPFNFYFCELAKFPLLFLSQNFDNNVSEIDNIFVGNVKERVLEVFLIFSDLLKINHPEFQKMIKNVFYSSFVFPLIVEIIRNPKNAQMSKKTSCLLFNWFMYYFYNK